MNKEFVKGLEIRGYQSKYGGLFHSDRVLMADGTSDPIHLLVRANDVVEIISKLEEERDNAIKILTNLVKGLDKTYWSSWQTTAHFSDELEIAENFLKMESILKASPLTDNEKERLDDADREARIIRGES